MKITETKTTLEKCLEMSSMSIMILLLVIKAICGDTSSIGLLAKKLISYLIISNFAYSTYKSLKTALKIVNRIEIKEGAK